MAKSRQVNVHEAKTQLSRLLAEVEQGGEVVVARDGRPVARLIRYTAPAARKLRTGDWTGRVWIAPDFDAPLSEDELEAWGQ